MLRGTANRVSTKTSGSKEMKRPILFQVWISMKHIMVVGKLLIHEEFSSI